MKIVSCYVAHFGKIKDFSYDFEEGFNPIFQENGWGKTTFSVFIKSMFFGMEYSPNTKRKLLERNHYLPWDGSVCGGNIVFTVKDRTYRVERTFGKTDKDDTFVLFDVATGLKSEDYSENLGEEIFKVDRDSFEKSVYVPQLSISTGMTDSLNAKMGNLATAKDDISNFDVALKSVKDARNEYTRNSKVNPGKLHAIKLELSKCREDYEKLPAIIEGYEAQSCLLEEKQEKLDQLTGQKNELVEKIQAQSKKEQELGAYKTYQENYKLEKAALEELDDFFATGLPEGEEITALEQLDRELAVQEQALESMMTENNGGMQVFAKPFEEKVPDETEFALWNRMATNLSELRAKAEHAKLSEEATKQLQELKFFFDRLLPTDEQLSYIEKQATLITGLDGRISQANERVITLKAQMAAESKNRSESEKNGVGTLLAVVLCLGFVGGGIMFSQYSNSLIGMVIQIVFLVLAVIDILLLVVLKKRRKNTHSKQTEASQNIMGDAEEELESFIEQRKEIEEECSEFLSHFLLTRAETMQENVYEIRRKLDQYNHLMDEENALRKSAEGTFDELADVQLELYTKLQPFATAYGINLYDMGGEYEFLAQLKKDADKYVRYMANMEDMARHENAIRDMNQKIVKTLNNYPVSAELSRSEQVHEIAKKAHQYRAVAERIDNLEREIKNFEEKYGVDQNIESVDDIQNQQVAIDELIVELNKQIIQDKENMSKSADEIERLNDIAEHIERLENQEKEYRKEAELLGLTGDFLQRARESFLSKYMEPLQTGLHKYMSLADSPEGTKSGYGINDFELDMDLNIKLDYSGSTKTAEYLSQGYQDFVALCSRLALVDVLYPEEKPILILDDPFTNLDDKKIKELLKLLNEISKERQTIYFTCHESRL